MSTENEKIRIVDLDSGVGVKECPYEYCFRSCGRYTKTGAAELAQIPSRWK